MTNLYLAPFPRPATSLVADYPYEQGHKGWQVLHHPLSCSCLQAMHHCACPIGAVSKWEEGRSCTLPFPVPEAVSVKWSCQRVHSLDSLSCPSTPWGKDTSLVGEAV